MTDRDTLSRDVDSLAEQIEARSRQFRSSGEFADLNDKLNRFAERHRQLRDKVKAAENDAWDRTKDDLAREHGALYNDFVKFEEKLDAEAMRDNPHGRAPGARSGLV